MHTPPARRLDKYRLKTSVIPLLFILIIGALMGVAIGGFLLLVAATPVSVFALAPVFASIAVTITIGIFLVPLWGLVGGVLFAACSADSIKRAMSVKLLPDGHPVVEMTQYLAQHLNLPKVAYVGVFPGDDINAFAAGNVQRNAMVAVSEGALKKLSADQLAAVLAHEVAHIANNDMQRMTYARSFQEALTWFLLFQGLKRLVRWLFTTVSELAILALSRSREYRADAIASVIIGPEAMIGALTAIAKDQAKPARKHRRFAHLMFRPNPGSWTSTHPSIDERVKAIQTEKYIRRLPIVEAVKSQQPAATPVPTAEQLTPALAQ